MVILDYATGIDRRSNMEAKKIVCTCLITLPCIILGHESYAASPGAFVGLGLGYGEIRTPNQSAFNTASPLPGDSTVVNQNKHDLGGFGALFYAGYNFSKNFGLEASYNHYADSDYATTQSSINSLGGSDATAQAKLEFKIHTYDIVAKGYLPFENGFELFARAGASYVIQKVNYSNDSGGSFVVPVNNDELATPSFGNTTTKRIRPTVGLGAGFNFTKNWELSFAWNHVFGSGNLKSDSSAIADLDMITLDITYSFV